MKYDSQFTELKNLLPAAKNILIALPSGANIDKLAAGLSLFLTFEASGKQVSIISDDTVLASHGYLYGVDHIQKTLPQTEGGNLTLTLEGVAASNGTVPALEKLDWFAEGNNLNLVFHVLPGQTFQPAKIVPKYQGSGFNLIFVIGAVNLNSLGGIYSQNPQVFSNTHLVNIDTQSANTSFGQTNVLDNQASSLSEVMVNLISDLGFGLDADSASNLLAGIFDATGNLSDPKTSADTFMAVANCLRVGGKKPFGSAQGHSPDLTSQVRPQSQPAQPTYDWSAVSAAIGANIGPVVPVAPQPSPEERPVGEGVISETVEPDWLTPKIFKGTSLG
ncbi:hypothetical protein KKE03_00750 [Patescibacteria group bacterium]|nr:hypothetical protein [Patescibacteria group bacterium]